MFCFSEPMAGCSGCKGNTGVCGKTAEVAKLRNELTGALIALADIFACAGNDLPHSMVLS